MRKCHTRSHSELGSQAFLRQWYFVLRHGRVGRCQANPNEKSYSIIDVAKMFKTKISYLSPRLGERYASALTNFSFNKRVIKKFGKISLKVYVASFIKEKNKL